jgi:hypothetical protein
MSHIFSSAEPGPQLTWTAMTLVHIFIFLYRQMGYTCRVVTGAASPDSSQI